MSKSPKLDNNVFDEISKRVYNIFAKNKNTDNISILIKEAIEDEKNIIKQERNKKTSSLKKLKFIKSLNCKRAGTGDIKKIAGYYAREIHCNFNTILYTFLQKLSPFVLNFWLNSLSLIQFFRNFRGMKELEKRIVVRGNIELIKRLEKFGALVIVPTHVSNFDSLVIGHLIHFAGLRPPLWGAGLNLYKGFTISYIMNNIGCYKVDRRKKNRIYIETLREYSTFFLEKGYNAIFYPGGTRSRTGEIENKVKLGLLGTVINAYINNIKTGKTKANIYVVPISLSYSIVPEAEELALEYFFGKKKKDKILERISRRASLVGRTLKRLWKNIMLDNPIYLTLGDPMDPLGNYVNHEGISVDEKGIPINLASVVAGKEINIDNDSSKRRITHQLGKKITESFHKYNTITPNQIFLYSILSFIQKKHHELSINEIVLLKPEKNRISRDELIEEIKLTMDKIEEKKLLGKNDTETIFNSGIDTFTSNYASRIISNKKGFILPNKPATIWFYSSRIRQYLDE
ncbi:MAG: 1-acyl-sn-glycerol-3-phosphate acyltransferase [Oligoflexia bacterium]|nr:1-acyl-sn-glycerol-3-phosphate acyltransferase [Oligoflexia bacterium]